MRRIGLIGALAVAASGLMVAEAGAQGFAPSARQDIGRAYVGASAGVVIPDDVHETLTGAIAGSATLSAKAGGAVTGLIGYHLNDYLAAEGELGYASFEKDSLSGTLNGVVGSAPVSGRVDMVLGFANAIVTPLGRSRVTPYLGGGVGFASFDDRTDSVGGIVVNSSGTGTDFAANFIAGIDVAVADRWSVGGRYRFIWMNSASTTSDGTTTIKKDDFTAHILTVNGTFHF